MKRYSPFIDHNNMPDMCEDDRGNYVTIKDYNILLKQYEKIELEYKQSRQLERKMAHMREYGYDS